MGKSRPKAVARTIETDPVKLGVLLLAYAHRYAASKGWKSKDRALARGEGLEDLVQDAMASLYGPDTSGREQWDPANTPDPMDYLRSFVNSRLSSLGRSYDNRLVRGDVDPEAHAGPSTPEALLLKKRAQHAHDTWWAEAKDLLLTQLLDDDLLMRIHDLMETEEIDKPADLALRLGVPVDAVKNAKKRLRRAWISVLELMGGEVPPPKEALNG